MKVLIKNIKNFKSDKGFMIDPIAAVLLTVVIISFTMLIKDGNNSGEVVSKDESVEEVSNSYRSKKEIVEGVNKELDRLEESISDNGLSPEKDKFNLKKNIKGISNELHIDDFFVDGESLYVSIYHSIENTRGAEIHREDIFREINLEQ